MPLSAEEQERLRKLYDLPEGWSIEETPEEVVSPELGIGDTIKARLPRALIPGAASLGGAALGAPVGQALIPVPFLGAGVGALAGGMLAGGLASYGQEKVIEGLSDPKDYQEGLSRYNQAGEQHPFVSGVVDALPQVAALGLPVNALKVAPHIFRGVKPSAAIKSDLLGMPVGASISGGVEAVRGLVTEGEINPERTAAAALIGGVLSKPFGPIGNRLFPGGAIAPLRGGELAPELQGKLATSPKPTTPVEAPEIEIINPNDMSVGPETIKRNLQVDPQSQSVKELIGREGKLKRPTTEQLQEQAEASNMAQMRRMEARETLPNIEELKGEALKDLGPEKNELLDIVERYSKGEIKEEDANNYFKTFRNMRTKSGLMFSKPNSDYSKLTPEDLQLAHDLAKRRGTTIQEAVDLIHDDGTPAAGAQNPNTRETLINPKLAGQDTPYHEIAGHQFIEDQLGSASPQDRTNAHKALEQFDFDKEALAQAIGRRMVETRQKPIKSWFEDLFTGDQSKLQARKAMYDKPLSEDIPIQKGVINHQGPNKIFYSGESDPGVTTNKPLDPVTKIFAGVREQLERLGTREGKLGSQALTDFENSLTRYTGSYVNKATQILRQSNDLHGLADYLYNTRHGLDTSGSSYSEGNPEVIELRNLLKEIHDEQRKLGILVKDGDEYRQAQDNPFYSPDVVDPQVIREIVDNGPHKDQLKKDYIEFLRSKDVANPEQVLQDYLNAVNSNNRGTSDFKAILKAEGYGLPKSWVEKDPIKLFERYGSKVARQFAYFKHIESSPELRTIFGVDKPGFLDAPNAKVFDDGTSIETLGGSAGIAAKARVTGEYHPESLKFRAVEKTVRSGVLGTLSAIKNHFGAYVQMQPYVPLKYQGNIIKAWGQLLKGLQDSMDKGVNRWDVTSLEVGEYFTNRWADRLSNFLRTIQGYKTIEQYTRAHNMMTGELLADAMWPAAVKGAKEEVKFFELFGPKDLDYNRPLTPDQILETAANFTERVQGSYNTKDLPHWLVNPTSAAYYIMSLSKWSVERANIVRQDVLGPAMKGNYGPLLRYTLGGILGGAAIRSISEMMSNKKQNVPTYGEALASKKGTTEGLLYQTLNLMQISGYAGMYADMAKMAMDASQGNTPRTPNIVSVGFAENVLKSFGNTAQAIGQGENSIESVIGGVGQVLEDYIQALRLVANNTYKAQDQERSDKFRDYRVYKKLEDKPGGVSSIVESNPLVGKKEREYKRTGDIKEARKLLQNEIIPAYKNLDPQDRQRKLESLKRNSYQVAPSEPRDLKEYLAWIKASQGPQALERLKAGKTQQDRVNRVKSSMVPGR